MSYFCWTFALVGLSTWCYLFLKKKYSYWSSRGIAGPPPIWPIGNITSRFNKVFNESEIEFVRKYGKVYGSYSLWFPSLTVADADLVKQMLIKDFQYFVDRINPKAYHELWNQNLFTGNGDDWKRVRTITSPTFSSGKLKGMSGIMQRCIDNLAEHFDQLVANSNGVMETKATIANFTIDVIASTSFATVTNGNKDPNNQFLIMGRKLFELKPLKSMACFILPTWMLKLLGIETFFEKEPFNFFIGLTKHIVESRRKAGPSGRRNDLVQMMLDASVDQSELDNVDYGKMTVTDGKEESKNELKKELTNSIKTQKKLTDSEIISNCILFFVAGFETTASALSHCLFELSRNPDIQERLHQDLHQALDRFQGETQSEEYFNAVMNDIPFLEAVIKETLRRYTPLAMISRICSKDGYQLGNITLQKNQVVVIPVVAIHLDPDYYPNPMRYDPDRFMPENKHLLKPYTYLPFSDGPRNCIAMRFAYQEIKLALAALVMRFKFSTTPETPQELSFKSNSSLLIANEFKLKVEKR